MAKTKFVFPEVKLKVSSQQISDMILLTYIGALTGLHENPDIMKMDKLNIFMSGLDTGIRLLLITLYPKMDIETIDDLHCQIKVKTGSFHPDHEHEHELCVGEKPKRSKKSKKKRNEKTGKKQARTRSKKA